MRTIITIAVVVTALLAPVAVWGQNPVLRDLSCQAASANPTDYTCTLAVAPSGYVTGGRYMFKADVANTAAAGKPTVNFSSLGARQVVKVVGGVTTALAANDIRAGQWVLLIYDGSNMQMVSSPGNKTNAPISTADLTDAAGLMTSSTAVQASQMPAMTGDCTTAAGSVSTTCAKTGGVAFGNAATKNVGTTAGTVAAGDDSRFPTANQNIRTIGVTFDGGGSALSGTLTRCVPVNFGGTITGATVIGDQAGSATVDVKTVAYASYTGPASAASITASATPALSNAAKYQDTTLSGWTTALTANTTVCFELSNPSVVNWVAANLKVAAN
jgi:hypothetical protein